MLKVNLFTQESFQSPNEVHLDPAICVYRPIIQFALGTSKLENKHVSKFREEFTEQLCKVSKNNKESTVTEKNE